MPRDQEGTSVTEFALLTPVLLLLLMGIIEGGRIFTIWLTMEHHAREAARLGAVAVGDPAREPTLVTTLEDQVRTGLRRVAIDPDRLQVAIAIGEEPAGVVDVHLRYTVDVITPMIQQLVPPGFTLRAYSAMRVE
ncbi:MAG: pilus assembly protein [Chloroflexi bacterium]|nr:pilus assembly protein [Chloroflexota bacterium]